MTQERPGDDRSIGQLVADATTQMQTLVKAEIALAKAELKHDAKKAGVGAGLFGGAAFFGYVALLFLSVAGGFGLHALGLAYGWAFLIVGGFYLVCALVLAMIGKANLDKMTKVGRTKRTLQDDAAWAKALKEQLGSPPADTDQLEPADQRRQVTAHPGRK